MSKTLTNNTKKLLYLSRYRGCKESEIIFSKFADMYLSGLTIEECDDYEKILEYPDSNILDWFMFKKQAPDSVLRNLVYDKIVTCVNSP